MAEGGGFSCPPCSEFGGAESGLAGSGVAGCFAFHCGELAVARFAAVAFDELGDAVVHLDGDVVRRAWRTGAAARSGHRRSRLGR